MAGSSNTFAARLARARARAGLTQVQAGALLERDSVTISRWERGQVVPDLLTREGALTLLTRAANN